MHDAVKIIVPPTTAWCMDRGNWCRKARWYRKDARLSSRMPALSFKLNQDRRHRIPRQQHKVTNWPGYEAGLRQRGSLTVWFTEMRSRNGQRRHAPRAQANPFIRHWRS
jgi:hypothetical protein